jgi:transposase
VVINAYESGEGTVEDVAEQVGVGTAFVKKMLRLHRAGERLEPQHGGGAQTKLRAAAREQLRAAVKTRPEATLGEFTEVLSSVCQGEVSAPTVWRALQRLEVPRKNRVSSPASALRSSGNPSGGKGQR